MISQWTHFQGVKGGLPTNKMTLEICNQKDDLTAVDFVLQMTDKSELKNNKNEEGFHLPGFSAL